MQTELKLHDRLREKVGAQNVLTEKEDLIA
jgi:hypothetical protein